MWKGFFYLLKKDFKMMLSGKFFLLAFLSLLLYSCYINFVYSKLEQEAYQICLYDPNRLSTVQSEFITRVSSRQALEATCADRASVGVDLSSDTPEIYMRSSGLAATDRYRSIWAEAVLSGLSGMDSALPKLADGKTEIIGSYNREQKSRREITAEFLFFELSAVGFLGLASILFKEKQMGVIRVHGVLPVSKAAFIVSKLSLLLLSDLIFALLLTWMNVGTAGSLSLLPAVLVQTGILSLIMALAGFFCALRLPDFKQFSLFYLILAVFITTPVFLAGQTGISWEWMIYHPMYHLFTAMKSAYFGSAVTSLPYYLSCLGVIAILFYIAWRTLSLEMAKEG